jgi:hypothetical protein
MNHPYMKYATGLHHTIFPFFLSPYFLRSNHKIPGSEFRFGGKIGKLDGNTLAIAVGVIQQRAGGGVIEEIVVGVTGYSGC